MTPTLRGFLLIVGVLAPAAISASEAGDAGQGMPASLRNAQQRYIQQAPKLYRTFFPAEPDLPESWRLPWQVPQPLRRFSSEQDYWAQEGGQSGGPAGPSPFTWMVGLPRDQVQGIVQEMSSAAAGEMPEEEWEKIAPPGFSKEQVILGSILTAVRLSLPLSPRQQTEWLLDLLMRQQPLLRKVLAADSGGGAAEDGSRTEGDSLALMLEPVRHLSPSAISEAIMGEVTSVRRTATMVYTRSNDWEAIQPGRGIPSSVRLGTMQVTLMILDADRPQSKVDDLNPDDAPALQARLDSKVISVRQALLEWFALAEQKVLAKLQSDMESTETDNRRERIREQIQEVQQNFERLKASTQATQVRVSPKDYGDSCYVVEVSGRLATMERHDFAFLGTLNAYLRNGTAVTRITMKGNLPPEQMQQDLDVFLSAMDASTAFFRE